MAPGSRRRDRSAVGWHSGRSAGVRGRHCAARTDLDWAVGGQRIGKLPSLPRSFAHSLQMLPITAITSLQQPTRFENKILLFLQLGKELSLIQLITIGYELCGPYGLSAQSNSGFLRRDPRNNPPAYRTLSREMRRNSRGQGGETSIELPHQKVRLPNGKLAFDASLSSSFVGRIWLAPPGA